MWRFPSGSKKNQALQSKEVLASLIGCVAHRTDLVGCLGLTALLEPVKVLFLGVNIRQSN